MTSAEQKRREYNLREWANANKKEESPKKDSEYRKKELIESVKNEVVEK